MNEGFFTLSEMKFDRYKLLPPRLSVELPKIAEKAEKPVVYIPPKRPQIILDIECYSNYFLAKFMRASDKIIGDYELYIGNRLDIESIEALLKKYEIVTFNGNSYDIPMLRLALTGASNKRLKEASDKLIKGSIQPWKFEEDYKLPDIKLKHIDLIELCIGMVSLKIYGGRLHCYKMQDLPYKEDTVLTEKQMRLVNKYCENDLEVTYMLLMNRQEQIDLRRILSKRYKVDLLSKSDAQIAEAVIKSEFEAIKKSKLEKQEISNRKFNYKLPHNIKFTTEQLNNVLDILTTDKFVARSNGVIEMPERLKTLKVSIGSSVYNLGIGGLHSKEKSTYHINNDEYTLHDFDVGSYYPSIILNCEFYPKQLGKDFLVMYEKIVRERLEAKAAGDKAKADTLKITLNGSFGKFGSPYSVLYAPDLMIQVTISGQLYLLMLIEMLENRGISVVSGNTDGIIIKCHKDKQNLMRRIIEAWEKRTGFAMEETQYLGVYSRDVNNYIAIKTNGDVKTKGIFASANIGKNPENEICTIAMIEYLKYGTPFERTIKECKDIRKFVTVRSVKGGATKDGKYLGKAVRFYISTKTKSPIMYAISGNKVPNSDNAMPLMTLSENLPEDIDYDYYIDRCLNLF